VKRALVVIILLATAAFAACVRDVDLSHQPPPDAIVPGPDGATPDAFPSIPSDGATPDA
jgi:hypothetical protein